MGNVTYKSPLVTEQKLTEFYNDIKPYLGGAASIGFTPIGTIISIMSNHAPANYLICDGQIVNIEDYIELANHFETEFGSKNYFGGDGITTFAMPDLRGEFLRGTGTNSHTDCGDGSSVGGHQAGTFMPFIYGYKASSSSTSLGVRFASNVADGTSNSIVNVDKAKEGPSTSKYSVVSAGSLSTASSGKYYQVSVRPTNTSVLYCIATKNIYMDSSNIYSTEEKVVGEWIDGKPLYQKTITTTAPTVATAGTYVVVTVPHNVSNVDTIFTPCAFVKDNSNITRMMPYTVNAGYQIKANPGRSGIQFTSAIKDFNGCTCYITIQYTKTID